MVKRRYKVTSSVLLGFLIVCAGPVAWGDHGAVSSPNTENGAIRCNPDHAGTSPTREMNARGPCPSSPRIDAHGLSSMWRIGGVVAVDPEDPSPWPGIELHAHRLALELLFLTARLD
jgi:hypothetical protein